MHIFYDFTINLESGIEIGQRINIGPGKFGKNNKRRAWHYGAWKICQKE